jgi:hypothetical protein
VYLLNGLGKTLKTFFREAMDVGYGEDCEPNCVYDNYANVGYLSPEIPRALWLWFVRPAQPNGDGNFLHPLPLQVAIAQHGDGRRRGREGGLMGGFVAGGVRTLHAGGLPNAMAVRPLRRDTNGRNKRRPQTWRGVEERCGGAQPQAMAAP